MQDHCNRRQDCSNRGKVGLNSEYNKDKRRSVASVQGGGEGRNEWKIER